MTMSFQPPVLWKLFMQLQKLFQLFVGHQNVYVIVPRNKAMMTNGSQEGSESHLI